MSDIFFLHAFLNPTFFEYVIVFMLGFLVFDYFYHTYTYIVFFV